MDKLDKAFYDKADIMLGFTDNAYMYFLKGNTAQRRKILEIISEEITYKDKNFDIKLKPIFQTIIENQYNLVQKNANNRTLETGIKKGLETNSDPNNKKYSPGWTTLELFAEELYEKIVDIKCSKIYSLIENFKSLA